MRWPEMAAADSACEGQAGVGRCTRGERKVGGCEAFRPSAIPARQHAISHLAWLGVRCGQHLALKWNDPIALRRVYHTSGCRDRFVRTVIF